MERRTIVQTRPPHRNSLLLRTTLAPVRSDGAAPPSYAQVVAGDHKNPNPELEARRSMSFSMLRTEAVEEEAAGVIVDPMAKYALVTGH